MNIKDKVLNEENDENEEASSASSEEIEEHEYEKEEDNLKISKRKKKTQIKENKMKKVKYENITNEKPIKNNKNDLHRAPTIEELNQLKETENLYNNNLFRLQIEEVIKETQIKNKYKTCFTNWFKEFQNFLDELPEFDLNEVNIKEEKQELNSKSEIYSKIKDKLDIKDLNIKLFKPENVEIFGLYNNNSLPGPILHTNIALTMPKVCFQVKDYLNDRYFNKKHCYLIYLAHYLENKQICSEINWKLHNFQPILEVNPKDNQKIFVKIFLVPPENYFKFSRFLPIINNSRNVEDNELQPPTVYYNSALAYDSTLIRNNQFAFENLKDLSNVQEAIKLIIIWLIQRELQNYFSDELVTYIMIYLITRKKINKHMSSYQVVRNFWNFMRESDWNRNPISICDNIIKENLDHYQNAYDIVFLDKTGFYNVTSLLDINIYKKVKCECELAFKLLDNGSIQAFHSLFITKLPFELQYDLIININENKKSFINSTEEKFKYLHHEKLIKIKKISQVLEIGLNKRAINIVPLIEENNLRFGINLEQCTAFHFLEMGPELTDPKEKEFREFWQYLSSDRRFKDGSVCVCVYFETKTIQDKRNIIEIILEFLLKKKLNLSYKLFYNNFDEFLINPKIQPPYPVGTCEEATLKVITIADELTKILRDLKMPLSITGVNGISDVFNYSDVFPPISEAHLQNKNTKILENNVIFDETKSKITMPRFVQPIEAVLLLEYSSKWPKTLESIQHLKTAFYLEISKLLKNKFKILSNVRPEMLDIFFKGLIFRFHFYLPKEIGLMKKSITTGITTYKHTPESLIKEKNFEILPKIVGALKGIQSQFPCYGPSTALIKRWLRSHLIDDYHFPDVVINLLNASLYLNVSPFLSSTTPQIGFLRFLKFFADLQWNLEPIIVNFNDDIAKETLTEIDSKLLQNRESYPPLYIIMPYDNYESLFTKKTPTKEILNRVKQLCKQTLDYILKSFHENMNTCNFKSLFIPNLDGYNVLIYIKPSLNPRQHEQIYTNSNEKLVKLHEFDENVKTIPITNFNPIQLYLNELRENYGDFANFFNNLYGGNVIGVLWKPKALEIKDFKISNVHGRKLNNEKKLILNIDGLIEDFYILGKDLIESIDVK